MSPNDRSADAAEPTPLADLTDLTDLADLADLVALVGLDALVEREAPQPDERAGAADPAAPGGLLAVATGRRAAGRPTGSWQSDERGALATFELVATDLAATIDALTDEQLGLPAPRSGHAWRVRDVVAHLVAVERYTASLLGGLAWTVPSGMELDHHGMTLPTIGELAGVEPAQLRLVWHRALATVRPLLQAAATSEAGEVGESAASGESAKTGETGPAAHGGDTTIPAEPGARDRPVAFCGLPLSVQDLLTLRAFELWTHEDDLRAAIGAPLRTPEAGCVRRMSDLAVQLIPLGMALRGVTPIDRTLRLVLTGPGGGTWLRALGPAAGRGELLLVADAVAFCRLAARRLDGTELGAHTDDDADLARAVLRGAAAFSA